MNQKFEHDPDDYDCRGGLIGGLIVGLIGGVISVLVVVWLVISLYGIKNEI